MNNNFAKLSLTLAASLVLAACSSGGSKNDDAAKNVQTQQTTVDAKAAAEKAAAEAKAKAEADAKAAALAKEEKVKGDQTFGHKFVKKTTSNFVLNIPNEKVFTTTSESSGRAQQMDIKLHPSLDTIVVSIPLDEKGQPIKNAPVGYLEDFDFRGNIDNSTGSYTLKHIYRNDKGKTTDGVKRDSYVHITKTKTMGTGEGVALVYDENRQLYVGADEVIKAGKEGFDVSEARRDRDNTVAEVYGHRTFVVGNSRSGKDIDPKAVLWGKVPNAVASAESKKLPGSDSLVGNLDQVNAPYLGKNPVTGKANKLDYVQYGRVTSKLNGVELQDVKKGVNAGNGTLVVSYAGYGEKGSENSYFYRGSDGREGKVYNANLAGDLAKIYFGADKASGKLNYKGHAVTYGLPHIAPSAQDVGSVKIPNAVYELDPKDIPVLVSGTHVAAQIDLATKGVTGQLYDVWSVDKKTHNQQIASFNGQLENNGSIAGSSTRTFDKAEGNFNGNLFGQKAEELGGALTSKATDAKNSWGAAFGAKIQENSPVKKSIWGIATDQVNQGGN